MFHNTVYTYITSQKNPETHSRVYELEIESANQKQEITDLKTEKCTTNNRL